MSSHLSDDQMVALLHGTQPAAERDETARHLRTCARCAESLAREAAVDQVLFAARAAAPPAPVPAPHVPAARSRRAPVGWLVGGAVGAAATIAVGFAGVAGMASATGRTDMGDPLAWQNLVFYIPLAAGLLLVLGSAVAGHDHDGGADHGGGADHDHDGPHGGDHGAGRVFSLLGVGRVPLTVVLMIVLLLFGGIGIILNTVLASLGLAPELYGPIALGASLVYTVLLAGQVARLVDRLLPTTETYRVTRQGFAGCTGTLLLPADASSGYAQVKDREGNVHNVKCRTTGAALPKGTAILIVEYDEAARSYVVDANPIV
jgi:membrane protein implicated in regulation of membrane protease activity